MFRTFILAAGMAALGLSAGGCQMDDEARGTDASSTVPPQGQCRVQVPAYQAAPFNTCAGNARVQLAIVGDVLLHWQLQQAGYARGGFRRFWTRPNRFWPGGLTLRLPTWRRVAPGLGGPGGRVMTDPGPVYGTGGVYSGYPAFNYHPPVVLSELKASGGVDIVTTANNHAMDRGARGGADMTLAEVAKAGLGAVGGSITAGAARDFVLRERTSLGTISFIACSFSTNGMPDPHHQVLGCYGADRAVLLDLVRREAAARSVAGVVVLPPHWGGQEYTSQPDANQRALARDLVAAGAMAVVGTHPPHAVQPWALSARGDGIQVPVVYSTGNFVAVQTGLPAQVGAMALLDLCKAPPGGGLVAHRGGGWVAMQMEFTPPQRYWLDVAPPAAQRPPRNELRPPQPCRAGLLGAAAGVPVNGPSTPP